MSLTSEERTLCTQIGFDVGVGELAKSVLGVRLERLVVRDEMGEPQRADALAARVDSEALPARLEELQSRLLPKGYRAFWSEQADADGTENDAIVVVRTRDPYEILRLCSTNGANYDHETEDLIDRLQGWDARYGIEIYGAAFDWVAVRFREVPDDLCAFAVEAYLFCPDTVDQGVGLIDPDEDPEAYAEAERLCPEIPPEALQALEEDYSTNYDAAAFPSGDAAETMAETVQGVKLLAREIHNTQGLFLWWD